MDKFINDKRRTLNFLIIKAELKVDTFIDDKRIL